MEREELNLLVTKARAGDPEAMNDLINASYQDIYFYALKLTKKEDIAADATQDSCLEIVETLSNLRESAAFVTWCRRIVYHQCAKRLGNTRFVPLEENEDGETILDRLPDETPGVLPEQVAEDREFRKTMQDMIDNLPEGQRSALLLYYYERLSVKQIAEIHGENENTIKSRLHQGRNAVKKQVEAYEAKTGTKLYSISVLPLLYFLFRIGKTEADAAAGAMLPGIQAAVKPAIAAACGAAGKAAVGTAFFATVGGKITAGVLAAALVTGAVVGGVQLYGHLTEEPEPVTPIIGGQSHTHNYDTWAYDGEAHWRTCGCDAVGQRELHTYEDGKCTACGMAQAVTPEPPQKTFDYADLSGRWLNIANDYSDELVREFSVSQDGTFVIQDTAYYPLGCDVFDEEGNEQVYIYLRDTPVAAGQEITPEEMHSATVSMVVTRTKEYYLTELLVTDPQTHNLTFHNKFYRESDYAGYEKVALTTENFSQYVTVSFRPFEFYYTSHNANLMTTVYMDLVLREDLGYPSWCQVQGKMYFSYDIVEYNVETQTYEIPDPSNVTVDEPLSAEFYGYKKSVQAVHTDGANFPTNGIIRWHGKNPKSFTPETVMGYVFVPVQ